PILRVAANDWTDQVVAAAIGKHGWSVPIRVDDGPDDGKPEITSAFFPQGAFVVPDDERHPPERVRASAVAVLEDALTSGAVAVESRFVVVHNPNAAVRIPPDAFGPYRQLVCTADDGENVTMLWRGNA